MELLLFRELQMIFVMHCQLLLRDYMCTTFDDPSGIPAFVAYRWIALDKCTGMWPIGIDEAICCIASYAILSVIQDDIQEAAGSLQLYASHLLGCEAVVHSMQEFFLPLILKLSSLLMLLMSSFLLITKLLCIIFSIFVHFFYNSD